MAKSELSFDLGNFDIVVSIDRSGGWPSLEVSEDINGGEYRTLLAVVTLRKDRGPWFSKPAVFTPDTDGIYEFMHWAGALCHVGNATIEQTVGFYNRLNLLLKVDVGNWERFS